MTVLVCLRAVLAVKLETLQHRVFIFAQLLLLVWERLAMGASVLLIRFDPRLDAF